MTIKAFWKEPIKLDDGKKHNLIFFTDVEKISENGGCYVFYNKFGNRLSVLYIGRAMNLRKRILEQFNNVKLMVGIKNSIMGGKFLMYCEISGNNKSKKFKKNLKILEKQLIKYAALEGHELLNQIGTKTKYKKIIFTGNRYSEDIFGRKMNISL